jgi:hypothetical protein
MIIIFVVVLFLIVIMFGVSSMMQSYSSAQQAHATIEVANATQMAVFGNVVVIMLVAIFLLAILVLVGYVITRKPTISIQTQPKHGNTPTTKRVLLQPPSLEYPQVIYEEPSEQLEEIWNFEER